MFYFIVFFILTLLSLFEFAIFKKKGKLGIYLIALLGIILISGLRWNTGNDWHPYKYFFDFYKFGSPYSTLSFEAGFGLFVGIVHYFTENYSFYLLAFAIVNIGIKGLFFYKNTDQILIALLLFWGTASFAEIIATRQAIAIGICLLGIGLIEKKKILDFLLTRYYSDAIPHISYYLF